MSEYELLCIVSGANIAGHMEREGSIYIETDEELLGFLSRELEAYKESEKTNWFTWIADALLRDYKID